MYRIDPWGSAWHHLKAVALPIIVTEDRIADAGKDHACPRFGWRSIQRLVQELFLPAYANDILRPLTDSAICSAGKVIAMTTDSYVVKPLFFPGGDIGRLCVSGTVNDLAVSGACPKYISVGMIIEAGLAMETLKRLVDSIAATAREAGVSIVTGDTKVVEGGAADGIFINTAGIGVF